MSVHNYNSYSGSGWAPAMSYGTYDPDEVNQAQAARNQLQQTKYMFGDPNNPGGGGPSAHDQFLAGQSREAQANQMAMARLPLDYQQSRFNSVFPWLQQQMGAGAATYGVGGSSAGQPTINANPVYNPQQIQQQVNSARAGNDRTMATQTRNTQQNLAGRGWGGNSPIAQAMAAQFGFQNLIANNDAERDIRFNSAKANSDQVLKGQTAREQQFANRQQEDIERRRTFASTQNALLGSLAGLI